MHPTVPVRIPEELLGKLDGVAASMHNSRNGIIRLAIDCFLKSLELPPPNGEVKDVRKPLPIMPFPSDCPSLLPGALVTEGSETQPEAHQ